MAKVTILKKSIASNVDEQIAAELRTWAEEEAGDWDDLVTSAPGGSKENVIDLYDDMPEIDSKAVARTSPIFERHFGIPLDVTLIRPGGYANIEEVVSHLIPKMKELAKRQQGKKS